MVRTYVSLPLHIEKSLNSSPRHPVRRAQELQSIHLAGRPPERGGSPDLINSVIGVFACFGQCPAGRGSGEGDGGGPLPSRVDAQIAETILNLPRFTRALQTEQARPSAWWVGWGILLPRERGGWRGG